MCKILPSNSFQLTLILTVVSGFMLMWFLSKHSRDHFVKGFVIVVAPLLFWVCFVYMVFGFVL